MSTKNEEIIQKSVNNSSYASRIEEIMNYLGKNQTQFSKDTELSASRLNNILKGRNKPDSAFLSNLIQKYRFVNPTWLMIGEGEMIKSKSNQLIENDDNSIWTSYNTKPIPLVSVRAVGGFSSESFSIEEEEVREYYVIPKFKYKKIDFMIEVTGSSMLPRYASGDIVACSIIKENSFIQWNNVYVIATKEQGIILKRINPSTNKDYIKVVADNPEYPPFEIPMNEITGLALVEGGVTVE